MPDRKKPNWLLWTTAGLVLLPVLYVASFGPACWIVQHGWMPGDIVTVTYSPLQWVTVRCPDWVGDAILQYLAFCGVDFG